MSVINSYYIDSSAPTPISVVDTNTLGTTTGDYTMTMPTNVIGDLLVIVLSRITTGATTVPSSAGEIWNSMFINTSGGSTVVVYVCTVRNGVVANATFSHSSNPTFAASLVAYSLRGTSTQSTTDNIIGTPNITSGNPVCPSIPINTDGAIVFNCAHRKNTHTTVLGYPSEFTNTLSVDCLSGNPAYQTTSMSAVKITPALSGTVISSGGGFSVLSAGSYKAITFSIRRDKTVFHI